MHRKMPLYVYVIKRVSHFPYPVVVFFTYLVSVCYKCWAAAILARVSGADGKVVNQGYIGLVPTTLWTPDAPDPTDGRLTASLTG